MTSTPFNVGLSDDTRLSSRVLRPPGGGHTDIFGAEPEPARTGRRQNLAAANQSSMTVGVEKPTNGTKSHEQNGQDPPPQPAATPDNAPAPVPAENGKADDTGKNENPVKTEAPAAAQQPAAEPPKRVRVPPGGFSSRLW